MVFQCVVARGLARGFAGIVQLQYQPEDVVEDLGGDGGQGGHDVGRREKEGLRCDISCGCTV